MSDQEDENEDIVWWLPHSILSRTNWFHRVNALRNFDRREMDILWECAELFLDLSRQFVTWAATIWGTARDTANVRKVYNTVVNIASLVWCEGYCYFLDYLVFYYPSTNRHGNTNWFDPVRNVSIDELSESDAKTITGHSRANLRKLYIHWRVPQSFVLKYRFSGEQAMLYYLYYTATGFTKLEMTRTFGGDPQKFTYAIRAFSNHLFNTFYHKVSDDSMRAWLPYINGMRFSLWNKIINDATAEDIRYDLGTGSCGEIRLLGYTF